MEHRTWLGEARNGVAAGWTVLVAEAVALRLRVTRRAKRSCILKRGYILIIGGTSNGLAEMCPREECAMARREILELYRVLENELWTIRIAMTLDHQLRCCDSDSMDLLNRAAGRALYS